MADESAVDRKVARFTEKATERLTGMLAEDNGYAGLDESRARMLAEELEPLLRPLMEELEAAELRAKLVLAELDEELGKAGFEGPQGIAGLKDAMGFLKRHRDDSIAFRDFISRIADIEGRESEGGPGEPIDLKDAMLRLDQIRTVIKEFDDYER